LRSGFSEISNRGSETETETQYSLSFSIAR
jgi:hypothetical protein